MLSRREKIYIVVLIVLAGGAGLWYFYLTPTMERIENLTVQVQTQESANDATRLQTMQMVNMTRTLDGVWNEELQKYENSLLDDWEEVTRYVLDEVDNPGLLRLLQELMLPRITPDSALSINISGERSAGPVNITPVSLSFRVADRDSLLVVVDAFRFLPYENRVTSLTVGSTGDVNEGELTISMNVEFLSRQVVEE